MAGSRYIFSYTVARRIALGGNHQKTVMFCDVQALNSTVAVGIEGVCQTKYSRQAQHSPTLFRREPV
jgi:hypothetical protein